MRCATLSKQTNIKKYHNIHIKVEMPILEIIIVSNTLINIYHILNHIWLGVIHVSYMYIINQHIHYCIKTYFLIYTSFLHLTTFFKSYIIFKIVIISYDINLNVLYDIYWTKIQHHTIIAGGGYWFSYPRSTIFTEHEPEEAKVFNTLYIAINVYLSFSNCDNFIRINVNREI